MNQVTLKTKQFGRTALRRCLELTDAEMIILATLAGNDTINFDEIQKAIGAHFRFKASIKFPNMASYIKNQLPTSNRNEMVRTIAAMMLGRTDASTLKRVEESLSSYSAVS